jgi:hypothetical protein
MLFRPHQSMDISDNPVQLGSGIRIELVTSTLAPTNCRFSPGSRLCRITNSSGMHTIPVKERYRIRWSAVRVRGPLMLILHHFSGEDMGPVHSESDVGYREEATAAPLGLSRRAAEEAHRLFA